MAKFRVDDNRWWVHMGRPSFEPGDEVTPNGNYSYCGKQHDWPCGEYRKIVNVSKDYAGRFWTIHIWNPCLQQYSHYNPKNFTKQENAEMAYEKTKFFAMKLPGGFGSHPSTGLYVEALKPNHPGDMALEYHTTPLRDSRHEVRVDVTKLIAEGDRWLVVQTVCLIEGEEPRPPIRVTEYK